MDVGIPVEVEGSYGEFYPGFITGINTREEYAVNLVDLSNNSCVYEVGLPPSAMRLPPELGSFPFDPMQGQEVDVLIPCAASTESTCDSEKSSIIAKLSAWWPGRVKKVGGGFVIVELVSTFTSDCFPAKHSDAELRVDNGKISVPLPSSIEKTDIVEKHQLRPRSHQPNFTSTSFHTHTIDIPDSLVPYCREPANYQHFARRCGSHVLVCMAPKSLEPNSPVKIDGDETYEQRARLLVISTDVTAIHRAAVIDITFIDMLRQKVSILQQTEELSRKLEASRVSQVAAPFVEELHVPESLIPYAIGFQGSNIRRATNIDGVLSIKLNRSTWTFHISGKTKEAVLQAKSLLDYTTEVIPVPRTYVNCIVGSGQRHIQHIVDCVGLSGLKIYHMSEEGMDDYVAFHLTGTSQAIRDARMFLEFHVVSLQDLDRLRGVNNPPALFSKNTETAEHFSDEEGKRVCGTGPINGPRRKNGRSSQRHRRRYPVNNTESNGDGMSSHADDTVAFRERAMNTLPPSSRPQRPSRNFQSKNMNPLAKDGQSNNADVDHTQTNHVGSVNKEGHLMNGIGPKGLHGKQNHREDFRQSNNHAPAVRTVM